MWVLCVLFWYSQPLFGLVNSSIKKIRLEWRLHHTHSMFLTGPTGGVYWFDNNIIQFFTSYTLLVFRDERLMFNEWIYLSSTSVETKIPKLIQVSLGKFVNFVWNFLDLTIYHIYQFCKFYILSEVLKFAPDIL